MSAIVIDGGCGAPVVKTITAEVVVIGGCFGASMRVNGRGEVFITRHGEGSYQVGDDYSLRSVSEMEFQYGEFFRHPLGSFFVRSGEVRFARREGDIVPLGTFDPQQLKVCRFGACFFNGDGDACLLVIRSEDEE